MSGKAQCQLWFTAALVLSLFFPPPAVLAVSVQQQVEKPLRQSIDTRQQAQKKVEQWQDDRADLTSRFVALTSETAELVTYSEKLKDSVEASRNRLAAKKQQLAEIKKISEEIAPFLDELLTQLREVSADGPPFLQEERAERLSRMEKMMGDPAISVGEKYRRLMEALHIEAEYGFTTEVSREEIDLGAGPMLMDIFRFGRLNLFSLSLDGLTCGRFNEAAGTWEKLEDGWLREIRTVIAMARKEQPVDLVNLPIGKISGAHSFTENQN
ncbi:DUF3450 domain-containing protein [Desulforhopalus vacuolatus]|uniref:DUF3450 domain-containing protein n=1 Tax=Desulforhopalus vacuolatus TaxID=40414 RepID=UPI001965772C|nr:DUF3450 domain-containing protein [Desulforhopalus vacuolatus]MBM9520791.1 DUF3450 domain-containing protein [Desulforhopalus vacuolatus]